MEFFKRTTKLGNSSGVLLPRALLGALVKITVVEQPLEIKKDVIQFLSEYFDNVIGIYVLNVKRKYVEVLAITTNLRKTISKPPYKIELVPLHLIKNNPAVIKNLQNSKVILNKHLLAEFKIMHDRFSKS